MIKQWQQDLNEYEKSLGSVHFSISFAQAPETLYHYTTLQGLISIITSQRIWATDYRYLNDTSEATHLWLMLERRLRTFYEEGREYKDIDLPALIEQVRDAALAENKSVQFVASFSEARDSLSQWRAYSKGNPGVAIGFNSKALNTQWVYNPKGEPHWTGHQFQRVMYISDKADAVFDRALEQLLAKPSSQMYMRNKELPFAREFAIWLSLFQIRFKHDAFKEEREWRLSFQRHEKPMRHQQFRAGKSTLIPYIEAELNKGINNEPLVQDGESWINEIVIGPSVNTTLTAMSVKQFLLANDLADVQIAASEIPYRDW